jgi:acyl-CoA reductase-like NAD-dependent aldehyde dehydrogenase
MHVPPRVSKAHHPAIIPGYDDGPVNHDAIVDDDDGWSRRGRLASTNAAVIAVVRQVGRAEWAHDSNEETRGAAAKMPQLALQRWRRVPSLVRSHGLVRVTQRLVARSRNLGDDLVRETGRPAAHAERAAARAADQLLRYAAIAANETELALTRYKRKVTGVVNPSSR